jgi:hypothetical protein
MQRILSALAVLVVALLVVAVAEPAAPSYQKKGNRVETILATLKASGLPTFEGKWHYIGPFDNSDNLGIDTRYPPEKEFDLDRKYDGKDGAKVGWHEFKDFAVGKIVNLKKFKDNDNAVIYLHHEFESSEAIELPISLGSDDGLAVFLNGERVMANNAVRSASADQDQAKLALRKGKNRLLLKVANVAGDWAVYVAPEFPEVWPSKLRKQLNKDFPAVAKVSNPKNDAEAAHYRIVTLPVPKDCVLEVGGLALRPDGKLLACTRRGEVWLISNPNSDDPDKIKFKLFATGLHEALGLHVDGKDVYVTQRPELTKLVDRDGDDVADEYITVCDKWGVSGDYHEFAFGPARDKQGNFYITLNVGFGGGHQSKSPWRGWCVKITPKGELKPFATGLRSPNGINFSPDGDLFYTDNQGEWVGTNKMHHLEEGKFYGHPAGLRWVKQSPFAKTLKESYPSGMLYDGQKGSLKEAIGLPQLEPPCIWFPYGRMGQSASEPIWDTTGGKFGPFAGQCFVGDQNKSIVMRVYLEKINGKYQGACFPFRAGFESGVNRLAFDPDGSMYVGMTNRGWGSVGGKSYGLQRLVYTGKLPFEMHAIKLTKDGFDVTFTKPLDDKTADKLEAYSLQSFTYEYHSRYGSDEMDPRAEKVQAVKVSKDRKMVSLKVDGFRPGRVYELNLNGVKSEDGDAVLHPVGYYTLNQIPK